MTLRLAWPTTALGLAGGFALEALLPLQDAWLAALAAAGSGALGAALLATGPDAEASLPPRAQVERWGTAAQFGHAFATAALGLAGLALGAALAALLGF